MNDEILKIIHHSISISTTKDWKLRQIQDIETRQHFETKGGSGKRSRDGECELRYMNVMQTTKARVDGCGVDTLGNPESRSVR